MFFNVTRRAEPKDSVENYKPLRDYSPHELLEFLDKNESIDTAALGAICSEVLRRQIKYGQLAWMMRDNGGR